MQSDVHNAKVALQASHYHLSPEITAEKNATRGGEGSVSKICWPARVNQWCWSRAVTSVRGTGVAA